MPRRKVLRFLKMRSPDPQVIEKYLLHFNAHSLYLQPEQFPTISSGALFANNLPLELEIGCGSGEYLCSLAQKDRSANFVGVDRSLKALYIGIEMAAELGLENIRFIANDFRLLYPLLVPESLRATYLHFPEPFNKQSMARTQRIFNASFLDQLHQALQSGGSLSVVSDQEAFFMEMITIAERDQRFEKMHHARYLTGFEPEVKSRFQHIWEDRAIVPLHFILKKL